MKKNQIRFGFNLVEITLALALIAIGLSSTFVLFPIGLNANKIAGDEAELGNVDEFISSIVRDEIQKNFTAAGVCSFSFYSGTADPATYDNTTGEWTSCTSEDKKSAALLKHIDTAGLYLYRRMSSADNADFSAFIQVYRDAETGKTGFEDDFFNSPDGGYQRYSNITDGGIDRYLLPVRIRISYPADVAAPNRTTRVLRLDVFNEKYRLP